jgi:hypothetical protein
MLFGSHKKKIKKGKQTGRGYKGPSHEISREIFGKVGKVEDSTVLCTYYGFKGFVSLLKKI